MRQKINEGSGPLSPRSMAQHISLSQILFYEEDRDEEKKRTNNPGDDYQPEQSKQVGFRVLHQGRASPEETFRFSISRLPRWAQDKVTNSDRAQINLESTPLQKSCASLVVDDQENARLPPEFQICSRHVLGSVNSSTSSLSPKSSDNSNSSGSRVPQETVGGHPAMDNRWLSIYNVCLDVLSSPEMQNVRDRKSVSSTNISTLPGYNGYSSDQADNVIDIGGELTSSMIANFDNSESLSKCEFHMGMKEADSREMEELLSGNVKNAKQAAGDSSPFHIKSEDVDLFKLHFGSLSTSHKKSEPSARRRYSSKYVVQKDYLGSTKRLPRMLPHDSGCRTLDCMDEVINHSPSEDLSSQVLAEQELDISRTAETLVNTKLSRFQNENYPVEKDPKRVKLSKEGNDGSFPVVSELQEQRTSCTEVLLGLDAAAENAVQLFSRLDTRGFHQDSLHEASKLLPPIIEKVNAIAKWVQCRNKDKCESTKDIITGFEPLLGTFAENLSQKVVEILKKNTGGDS